MLAAAQLAFRLLPTEDPGAVHLSSPDRDDVRARTLFVGGFYETVLSPRGWKVGTGMRIQWQVELAPRQAEILPSMQTDRPGSARWTERQAHQRLVIIRSSHTS